VLSQSIYHEIHFLLYSFALGIIITFVYDNIRVVRRVLKHNTFFISIEDLLFWIGVALSIFLLQHRENEGVFRWFSVAGAFLGMIIYKGTVSHFYIKETTVFLRKLLKALYILFSYLFSPIYFLERKTGEICKKVCRHIHSQLSKQKIRLTSKRKMIKMTLCKHKKRTPRSERREHEQKDRRSQKKTKRI